MRLLNETEIKHITIGASILGSGGGGDPYIGKVMALDAIKKFGPVKLLSIDELKPDMFLLAIGGIGSPAVIIEELPNGEEAIIASRFIEKHLNRKISAIYPVEVGGINSLLPLATAARLGVPLIDVDLMGRAFPEYHMTTLSLDGISASPFVVVDVKLNVCLINTTNNHTTEQLARTLCAKMGGSAFLAAYPITSKDIKKSGIPDTLSLAQRIGETVEQSQSAKANTVQALLNVLNGFVLFHGKLTKVDQRTEGGFTRGVAFFSGVGTNKEKVFEISFQNEYLLAKSKDRILCTTPDLIILLNEETGIPILTERLRYGTRVFALGVPANKRWRTPCGIKVVGPRYFNYDTDFRPVEDLNKEN